MWDLCGTCVKWMHVRGAAANNRGFEKKFLTFRFWWVIRLYRSLSMRYHSHVAPTWKTRPSDRFTSPDSSYLWRSGTENVVAFCNFLTSRTVNLLTGCFCFAAHRSSSPNFVPCSTGGTLNFHLDRYHPSREPLNANIRGTVAGMSLLLCQSSGEVLSIDAGGLRNHSDGVPAVPCRKTVPNYGLRAQGN